MRWRVILCALVATFTSGCSSDGNPLLLEGIRFEDGEMVACFREGKFELDLSRIRLLDEMKPDEAPASRYIVAPDTMNWDLVPQGTFNSMQGIHPSGTGTATYIELDEDSFLEWEIKASLSASFQLQGDPPPRDDLRFEVYDRVPATLEESALAFVAALIFGIKIEVKPPLGEDAGMTNLQTILNEIQPGLGDSAPGFTWQDPTGVPICHSDGVQQEIPDDETEIIQFGIMVSFLDQAHIDNMTMKFPTSGGSHGLAAVSENPITPQPGLWNFTWQIRKGELDLTDTSKILQFGFVYDIDNNDADNFKAGSSFPKDLFDETDFWLNGGWNSSQGLFLNTTDARNGMFLPVSSQARIIQYKQVTLSAVPADETFRAVVLTGPVAPPLPPYRVTIFKHFGDFGLPAPGNFKVDTAPTVDLPLARVVTPN